MKVNILGFGTMGRQICALMEACGFQVLVWARNISEEQQRRYKIDKKVCFKNLQISETGSSLEFTSDISSLSPAITIESLVEDLEVKHQALSQLTYEPVVGELFTNTSSLFPREVHPAAAGLHFFNPTHLLKIIETTLPEESFSENTRLLITSLKNLGFQLVSVQGNRGYVGNFILFQEISAALRLVDSFNYTPQTIDDVMSGIGRTSSIFDVIDFIGVDTVLKILNNLSETDSYFYVSPLLNVAVSEGILGRKNKTSIREIIGRKLSDSRVGSNI